MAIDAEIEAYAAYMNGLPRATAEYDAETLQEYVEDLQKAKAALEVAWLQQIKECDE